MTATNEQIIAEAERRSVDSVITLPNHIIEVMRENWTPPEPVDPDVLAMRKLLAAAAPEHADAYLRGDFDGRMAGVVEVYKAGREQERDRAKVLVEFAKSRVPLTDAADVALAKYRGEA